MKKYFLVPIFALVFHCQEAKAQMLYDTLFIKKYYTNPIWSLFQNGFSSTYALHQNYNAISDPNRNSDINLVAESFRFVGVSYAKHRKFWAVNLLSGLPEQAGRKPRPQTINIYYGISDYYYNFEFSAHWFQGYYDSNSAKYTMGFTDSSKYIAPAGTRSFAMNAKYMYFTNYKRFSYNAVYRGTSRQKKSAGTALVYGDINYTNLWSDTGIIPAQLRPFYTDRGYLKGILALNLSAGAGVSGTLVLFKTFFVNGMLFAGPAFVIQSTAYQAEQKANILNVTYGLSGGLRMAFGLNFDRVMIYNTTTYNVNYFQVDKIDVSNTIFCNSFNIGIRFGKMKN